MLRIVIYGRFSSELQNERSADDQIEAIRAEVRRRFPHWKESLPPFKDEAISGRNIANRPAFSKLLELARQMPRPFDAIVVEDISRAFRNREEAARTRSMLRPLGIRIISMAEGDLDPDSEAALWVGGIKEIKAEADSLEIARRTRRGQRLQAERGYSAGGPTNFGYRRKPVYVPERADRDGNPLRDGVVLEPDPLAAPAVRKVFSLFVEEGWGLRRVALFLNDPRNGFAHLKRRGFCPTFVRTVLQNRVYLGERVYNVRTFYRGPDGRRRYRRNPPDQWTIRPDAHPPLVDRPIFEKAQALFAARREAGRFPKGETAGRNARHLLSGLLRCVECGAPMVARASGGRRAPDGTARQYSYYVCGIRHRRGPNACTNSVSIPLGDVDRWVLDTVDEFVLDEDAIEFVESKRRRILLDALEERSRGEEAVARELSTVEREIARLVDALKEGLPARPVREELERLEERRSALSARAGASEGLRALLAERIDRHLASNALRRSRDILACGNAFRVREELAGHVREMSAAPDGLVRMVTRSHSLFGDLEKILGASFGRDGDDEPDSSLTGLVAGAGFEPATSGL